MLPFAPSVHATHVRVLTPWFTEADAVERDRGNFDFEGTTVYFKIDYYDAALEYGSEDPSDASKTRRVLTIMIREDL